MAITVVQKPYTLTPLNQKLIFNVSSTQIAQPGFRFVMEIQVAGETLPQILITPNAASRGIAQIEHLLRPYIKQSMTQASPNTHRTTGYTLVDSGGDIEEVVVTFYDGYEIAGIFTVVDGPSDGVVSTLYIWNGHLPPYLGYRPDPNGSYQLGNGPLSALKESNTYSWDQGTAEGFTSEYFIPVDPEDYGVINFLAVTNAFFADNPAGIKVRQVVQEPAAVPVTVTQTLTIGATPQILILGAYPANVNDDGGLTWTQPTALFKWMSWQILDGSNNPVSSKIVMFNVAHISGEGCIFDRVRLGWANNEGGWDYFNFTLKSEVTHEIERKRFKKLNGTYNATTFDFPIHDRGHQEFDMNVESFMELTSDWISEPAFRFLRSLLISKDVYIVSNVSAYYFGQQSNDLAVVIEDSTYRERAERSSKKYNLSLKLKFSLNQFSV